MTPTEDYLRQIEYWKDAAGQAEDEATFLRGQYDEAEEKRSKAEAKVAQAKADRDEARAERDAVSGGNAVMALRLGDTEAQVSRLEGLILGWALTPEDEFEGRDALIACAKEIDRIRGEK